MTITELIALRDRTETAVRLALGEFQRESGLIVANVEVTYHTYDEINQREDLKLQQVKLDVRLP